MSVRVGIIRGGLSDEFPVSIKTGAAILKHFPRERFIPHDILIDREGVWHLHGWRKSPEDIFKHIDVALIALHGYYGEDGKIQKFLEDHRVPFVGSGPIASAVAMNKILAKNAYKQHNLKTPFFTSIALETYTPERVRETYRRFPQPSVVKPYNGGSSQHVVIAKNFNQFKDGVEVALKKSGIALIEEYIKGREATCGILDNFRNEKHYILPPVEIIPPAKNGFFDYECKYDGSTREICPSGFAPGIKKEIMRMALCAHRALGLRHLSRSDFIISPRGIYILETNTLPGMTEESLFPKPAAVVGLPFPELLEHLLRLALSR